MKDIYLGKRLVGPNHPPLIVAEISANHQQSLDKALELVDKAVDAGVEAIKLQTYTPDTLTLNSNAPEFVIQDPKSPWYKRTLYDIYSEGTLPWEWHEPIFNHCKKHGLLYFSTPFDETAIDFLEKLDVPCYKIASLEMMDLPLIRKAAGTGKPLIISTGGATILEISEAVFAAKDAGCTDLILLKCTITQPATAQDANLRTLPHLSNAFNTLVGLSDHVPGIGVAVASVALGACLIEKHFTLSRTDGSLDSFFSLEPDEFRQLVTESRNAWQSLGKICYEPLPSEKTLFSIRPSLYFVVDIDAGMVLKPEHIRSVRPNKGLPPKEEGNILGLTLKKAAKKGTPVSWEYFKG